MPRTNNMAKLVKPSKSSLYLVLPSWGFKILYNLILFVPTAQCTPPTSAVADETVLLASYSLPKDQTLSLALQVPSGSNFQVTQYISSSGADFHISPSGILDPMHHTYLSFHSGYANRQVLIFLLSLLKGCCLTP